MSESSSNTVISNSSSSSSSCGFEVIERSPEKDCCAVSHQNGLKFNQVIFDGIFDVYPKDCNVFSSLSFRNNFIQSEGDKILLMQVGWTSLSEAIVVYEQGLKNTISVDCQNLDTIDALYQLCYITDNKEVVGMSTPWSVKEVQEPDLIGTSKSRFSVLMKMYQDLYLENEKLNKKADYPLTVFQKLMEKAQAQQDKMEILGHDESLEPKWVELKMEDELGNLSNMLNSLTCSFTEVHENFMAQAKEILSKDPSDGIGKVEKGDKVAEIMKKFENVDGLTFGYMDGDPDPSLFASPQRTKKTLKKFKDTLSTIGVINDKIAQRGSMDSMNGNMRDLEAFRRTLLSSIFKHLFPAEEPIVFSCGVLSDIWHQLVEDEAMLYENCENEETYLRGMKYLQDKLEKYVGLEYEIERRLLMCRRNLMNFLLSGVDRDQELQDDEDVETLKNLVKQPTEKVEQLATVLSNMRKTTENTEMQLLAIDNLCQLLKPTSEESKCYGKEKFLEKEWETGYTLEEAEGMFGNRSCEERFLRDSVFPNQMAPRKFEYPKPKPRNLTKKMDEEPIAAYLKKPMKKGSGEDETCVKCEEMKKRLEDGATAYIDLRIQFEHLLKNGRAMVD